MNEYHDNGLNMCSIKSPNASPFADSEKILHTVPLIDSTVATVTIFDF